MTRVVASAPGKLVLIGEYAVLDGAQALVTAVDTRAEVTLSPSARWSLSAPQLSIAELEFDVGAGNVALAHPKLAVLREVLVEAARGQTLLPQKITTQTRAFFAPEGQKLGLGSSAAVATALYAGLWAVGNPNSKLQASNCFDAVRAAHTRAQGAQGSGIDVAASAHGQTVRYALVEAGPLVTSNPWPTELWMHVVWIGHSANTSTFVRAVQKLKQDRPDVYHARLAPLYALATQASDAFATSHASRFVELAHDYGRHMGELGDAAGIPILSEPHRALAHLVKANGGGYKPSGAGGGDVGLVLSSTAETHKRLGLALDKSGFTVLALRCSASGVSVITLE